MVHGLPSRGGHFGFTIAGNKTGGSLTDQPIAALMRLRTALNAYKSARADGERFPEEARTVDGALSGHGDRLVHVGPAGALRDHSTPLSGLSGVDRSRFGVRTPSGITWFDDLDAVRQHYYRETTLVETEYDAGAYTVHQYLAHRGYVGLLVNYRGGIGYGKEFR